MTDTLQTRPARPPLEGPDRDGRLCTMHSPFLRAPEIAKTIFVVTIFAALGPLAAGTAFFGWRSLMVAAIAVTTCSLTQQLYYRFTRIQSLMAHSHAYLTGLLLALTLPAYVPWYVPVIGGIFAILVGKAVFGGVGHFLWQPALVGRLAVAVLFADQLVMPSSLLPGNYPLLAQSKVIVGDVRSARHADDYRHWRKTPAPPDADAFLLVPPAKSLEGLTKTPEPQFSALAYVPVKVADDEPGIAGAKPAALMELPPISDLLIGARPGGIGETSAIVILMAGLYLIYRNYVKWQLPVAFLLAACAVAAVAPIQLQGPGNTVIWGWGPPGGWSWENLLAPLDQWTAPPLWTEGYDVGAIYVVYQLLAGEFLLAAFFLAPEMTSRPVTSGGQVLFGVGCGTAAMLLQLYVNIPIPAYMAVLLMNTFTPTIDRLWRPRVFGKKRLAWLRRAA